MANYPASKDDSTSLPNPTGSSTQASPDHAALHTAENAAIIALESKLGTGATTPTTNTLLLGTGTGTSAWGTVTSSQLAAAVSDETGTGSVVFATTPTLVTPKVDTINENTLNNGVTVAGMNVKSGVIQTSNAVSTAALAAASVTPAKLATGASEVIVATSETTTSTSFTDLATVGPSITVTIGSNGIALLNIYAAIQNNTASSASSVGWVASGANTIAVSDTRSLFFAAAANNAQSRSGATFVLTGLNAGATTFKLQYKVNANTGTFIDRRISVVPL